MTRSGRVVLELLAGLAVAGAAAMVFAVVVDGPRADLLFSDGDSVVLALVHASRTQGLPQEWTMSTVGFLPELWLYSALSVLGLGAFGTLAVNGIVNVLLAYGALRVVAAAVSAARGRRSTPTPALVGIGIVLLLSITESSADRTSIEIVSLLFTTTYYGLTVVAMALLVGLAVATLATRSPAVPARGSRRWWPPLATVVVTGIGAGSNALLLPWAVAPLLLVLGALVLHDAVRARRSPAVRARRSPDRRPRDVLASASVRAMVALVVGVGVGAVVRVAMADTFGGGVRGIVGSDRAEQPSIAARVAERLATPAGAVEVLVVVGLLVVGVVASVRAARRHDRAVFLVATVGWVAPLVTVGGFSLVGLEYTRYLQPVVWGPVIALCAIVGRSERASGRPGRGRARRRARPRLVRGHAWATGTAWATGAVVAAGIAAGGAVAAPSIVARAEDTPEDVRCVADWIDASGRRGAGEFWAIRAVKARIADQRSLVQVDRSGSAQYWMVNRADFAGTTAVSFVVVGPESRAERPAVPADVEPERRVACGALTVLDYREPVVPVSGVASVSAAASVGGAASVSGVASVAR